LTAIDGPQCKRIGGDHKRPNAAMVGSIRHGFAAVIFVRPAIR
jgi:hypothetical protein